VPITPLHFRSSVEPSTPTHGASILACTRPKPVDNENLETPVIGLRDPAALVFFQTFSIP